MADALRGDSARQGEGGAGPSASGAPLLFFAQADPPPELEEICSNLGVPLDQQDRPDVIRQRLIETPGAVALVDISLPGSLDLIRGLTRAERLNFVPVMALGTGDSVEEERAFTAGACDVFSVPLDVARMRGRLRFLFKIRGREMDLVRMGHDWELRARDLEHRARALEASNRRLRVAVVRDELTGLLNRRRFNRQLQAELRRAERLGRWVSLLLVDIDHFKRINDTLGHPAGDDVLTGLSEVLTESVRSNDTVCRYGGEEFAVILPETGPDAALAVASRVRELIAAAGFDTCAGPVRVTISGGLAATRGPSRVASEEIIEAADAALYTSKRSGRDRITAVRGPRRY